MSLFKIVLFAEISALQQMIALEQHAKSSAKLFSANSAFLKISVPLKNCVPSAVHVNFSLAR